MTDHHSRSFRFGVVLPGSGDLTEWPQTARHIEALGYSTLLVPDTLATPSPFLALAAAAVATRTLRLGTWVLAAPYRSVGQVVRDTATLQALSGNRVELGVGAGRPGGERDAEVLGATWGTPGERVELVERTLRAVRDEVSPAPHIVVAGAGARMLRIAAEYAVTIALTVSPTADAAELAAAAARVRAAAGERTDDIELSLQITGVGDSLPAWVAQQMGVTAGELRDRGAVGLISADPDEAADQLRRLRELSGASYLTVPGQFAEAFAPVASALTDT